MLFAANKSVIVSNETW